VAGGKRTAADLGAWLIFEDESGQGLRPPKGRTWGRRGATPVVTVTGAHNTRVSLAALIAVKPGRRPRLIYRVHRGGRGGKDRRKGASPRRTTPLSWTPRTSNSAARSWWCGTT
jgi:putative transposase